jgi:hypothetical protein
MLPLATCFWLLGLEGSGASRPSLLDEGRLVAFRAAFREQDAREAKHIWMELRHQARGL